MLQAFRGGSLAATSFRASVAGALAGVAGASVRMAAQLDKDLRLIQTLGGEAKVSVEGLRHELGELSKEFGRNVNELARANYQAVSTGFTEIAESMAVLRAGTKLAVAGNGDVETSTATVAGVLNAFGKEAEYAGEAASALFNVIRVGKIDAAELGTLMQDLPATAAASGISLREMGAALSVLTVNANSAPKAIDQLRSALLKLGVEGYTGTLESRLERLSGKTLPELVDKFGDQNAAIGLSALTLDKYREALREFDGGLNKLDEAVSDVTSGTMGEWARTWSIIKDAAGDLGHILNTVLTPAIRELNSAMDPEGRDLPLDSWVQRQLELTNRAAGVDAYVNSFLGGGGGNPAQGYIDSFLGGSAAPAVAPGGPYSPPPMGIDYGDLVGANVPIGGFGLGPEWAQRNEARRYGYATVGALGPGSNPYPNLGANMDDFITGLGDVEVGLESVQNSSVMATAAAGILSSSIGGLLTSAFVTADSAAGRFVQGLLAQFAQLGLTRILGTAFGLPGFATGGFTGSTGGMVHPNEYVFSADAVRSIGLGTLDRAHDVAKAGGASVTINQTVNGGNPAQVAEVTKHAVESALRDSRSSGTDRFYRTGGNRWR